MAGIQTAPRNDLSARDSVVASGAFPQSSQGRTAGLDEMISRAGQGNLTDPAAAYKEGSMRHALAQIGNVQAGGFNFNAQGSTQGMVR